MMKESDSDTIESNGKDVVLMSDKSDIANIDVESIQGASVVMDVENSNELKNDVVSDTSEEEIEIVNATERKEGMTKDDTDVTTQSFRTKVLNLITCARVASIVYVVSVVITMLNEGRTVKSMKNLNDGRETVIEFDLNNFTNTSIPTTYKNQLIHVIGDLSTSDIKMDPIFGVSSQYNVTTTSSNKTSQNQSSDDNNMNFLKLSRTTSMYQWKEYEKNDREDKTWSTNLLQSRYWRKKKQNPAFPFHSVTLEADPIYLGNTIKLNKEIVSSLSWYEPLDTIDIHNVPNASLRNRLTKFSSNGYFYQADNTTASSVDRPSIGDVKITFEVTVPDTVSIIACLYHDIDQDGYNHNLGSHITDRGGQILLIERGNHTSTEMFNQAENEITASALKLRIWGYVLMVVSMFLFILPCIDDIHDVFLFDYTKFLERYQCGWWLSTFIDIIFPFIFVGIVAIPNFIVFVALVWIAYQPAIAIPVMLGSLCVIVYFAWKIRQIRQEQKNNNDNEQSNNISENDVDSSAHSESFVSSDSSDTGHCSSSSSSSKNKASSDVEDGQNDETSVDSSGGGGADFCQSSSMKNMNEKMLIKPSDQK